MVLSDAQIEHLVSIEPDDQSDSEKNEGQEANDKRGMMQLELTNDIYVVGVLQFLDNDSAQIANRVVFKCVFAFSLQFALIALLLYQYSERGDANVFSTIFAGSTSLNATRLLVAVLLNL